MEIFSYKILPLKIYLPFHQEITPSVDIRFNILKGLQVKSPVKDENVFV